MSTDFSDGQWIAIWIGVVVQHLDGDRCVVLRGHLVIRCHRCVIDWGHVNVNRCRHRYLTVGHGVFELGRTIVVFVRCERDGAVCVQRGFTVFYRNCVTSFNVFTVDLGHSQGIAVNVFVVGQYVDGDRCIFWRYRFVVRRRWGVVQRSHGDV